MIQKISQIMLYVNDPKKVAQFWIDLLDFVLIHEADEYGIYKITIAPNKESETQFVLMERAAMAKLQPELNLGIPSVMLAGENLEQLRRKLQDSGVKVGELMNLPEGKLFNFTDPEGNYFAVIGS